MQRRALAVLLFCAGSWQAAAGEEARKHLETARAAERTGDFAGASRAYRSALQQEPNDAGLRQSLGLTLHLQALHLEAIPEFEKAIALDASRWGAHLFLGIAYYRTNQFAKAVSMLERSIELNAATAEPDARFWLSLASGALGRFDERVEHLRRFLTLRPRDPEGLYQIAKAYDQYASALFEQIGRREPESPLVYLLQAERLAAEGRNEVARKWYARAAAGRPDLEATLASWKADAEGAAEDRLKAALAKSPGDPDTLYRLGRVQKKRAADSIELLLKTAPDSARARQLEGERHEQATEYSEALQAYQAALARDPALPGIRYAIGNIHWKMRQYSEAERWLSEEIRTNRHHGLAHFRLGSIYADQNRSSAAISHLEEALRLRPELVEPLIPLGRAYMSTRQADRAVASFRRYATADPSNDRVHYLLSTALRALGRMAEADAEMKRFQELNRRRHQEVQAGVQAADQAVEIIGTAPQ